MAAFKHFDLALLNPAFDSPLVDVLTELEHLRRLKLAGTTPAPVFFQLKRIFHMLESLGSARIEGNHTTLADYVESSLEGTATAGDHLAEVANIEEAMAYIESALQPGAEVSEHFIRELHALAVRKLVREGDATCWKLAYASAHQWRADPDQRVRRQADDLELGPLVPRMDVGAFAGQARVCTV